MGFCDCASLQKPIRGYVGSVTASLQFGCGSTPVQNLWHRQLARDKRQQVNVTPACFNMLC
jgi:hypothetical protein